MNKWFPSSKLCSNCGSKKAVLELSERIYKCEYCNLTINRDYNSALNLKTVGSTGLAWLPVNLAENKEA
ncbi:MAG: zinc ribbon domain-containing protein [Sarcina sp.]